MVKSKSRKIKDLQNHKPNTSKRENKNRGKHGCSRLHAMRSINDENYNNIEQPTIIKIKQTNSSLLNKLKGMLKL